MNKEIVVDDQKIFYQETGNPEGKPVIILHGWGCSHETVSSIARILEPSMRVFNLDLPGHGKSPEPREVWGTEEFASSIKAFIKALDLKKPSLIGHSFGGRTSILVASQIPIDKLVLVDSAGIKPKRSFNYYRKVYSFKLMKKVVPVILGKERGHDLIEKIRNSKGSADYRAASAKMKAVMSKCVNQDLKHVMPSINCPTLLIWGENDTATPLKDAQKMEKLIPDCGLVSFTGCGHYSFLDNPAGFRAVIKEFFK